jgi:hypothetical protein
MFLMEAMTISPPMICKGCMASPKKMLAITPADIANKKAAIAT